MGMLNYNKSEQLDIKIKHENNRKEEEKHLCQVFTLSSVQGQEIEVELSTNGIEWILIISNTYFKIKKYIGNLKHG